MTELTLFSDISSAADSYNHAHARSMIAEEKFRSLSPYNQTIMLNIVDLLLPEDQKYDYATITRIKQRLQYVVDNCKDNINSSVKNKLNKLISKIDLQYFPPSSPKRTVSHS